MVSLKNIIIDDPNTRSVSSIDTQNAFYEKESHIPVARHSETRGVYVFDWDKVSWSSIVFSTLEYATYLSSVLSEKDSIIHKAYISPREVHFITDQYEKHFNRHKHNSSWRNFCKSIMSDDVFGMNSFVVKWWDMLTWGELNNMEYSYAFPMYGAATVKELEQEFKVAQYVQNVALKTFWRPTYLPQPIKLSILDNYIYPWDDSIVDYRSFVKYLIHTDQYHRTNMCSLDMELNRGHFLNNKEKKVYSFVDKDTSDLMYDYWNKLWDHWSYLYMIQGTNMRITDVLSLPSKELMRNIIRQHYPQNRTDEQILEAFMGRFAEVHGLMLSLGFRFKPGRISWCFPWDTTIQWVKMDVWTYTMQGDVINEEFIKQQIPYTEICFLMYTIFYKPNMNQFQLMFDEYFYKKFCESFFCWWFKEKGDSVAIDKKKLYDWWKRNLLPLLIKWLKISQENPKNRVASMKHIKEYLNIIND